MASEHSRVTQLSTSAKRLDHSLTPPEKLQLCCMLRVGSRCGTQVAAQHLNVELWRFSASHLQARQTGGYRKRWHYLML